MNFYRFRRLLPSSYFGESYHFIRWLKKQTPFRWAHFDVYMPNRNAKKTILCFGQIHTVSRGKISWWTAKRIAKVQARLLTMYSFLLEEGLVHTFGVEGFTDKHGPHEFRFDTKALESTLSRRDLKLLKEDHKQAKRVKKIFIRLAKKWYRLLKKNPNTPEKVSPVSGLINGIRMLNFLEPKSKIYPIEGEKEYRFLTKKLDELQDRIHYLEQDTNFISAKKKNFKNLSQKEYDAVKTVNDEVNNFNTIIKAPLREEAHMNLALRKLKNKNLTAFVMGIGHRVNLLQAAKLMLKDKDASFVLITPQELWLWRAVVKCLKILVFVLIFLGMYIIWNYY